MVNRKCWQHLTLTIDLEDIRSLGLRFKLKIAYT